MRCRNPFAFKPGPVSFWTTVIYLAVAIPLLYVHETVPSAPPSDSSLYGALNLTEAWLDLQTISNAYHPYNSHQNDVVRDYILRRSRDILQRNGVPYVEELLGGALRDQSFHHALSNHVASAPSSAAVSAEPRAAEVVLFDDQISNVTWTYDASQLISASVGPKHWAGQYFEGNNLYIYVRGLDDPEGDWWNSQSDYNLTHRKGGVLVNCHFDSVATGFGATDDGMSCVTMLQLLGYFTSPGRQPRNGIVLLFNNAEEDGLLGAYAFGESPVVDFCHTFVNLEGAGAGGRAMLFRATDLQSAEAYSKSPHPFGSIVASDAFKLGVVRSGTDYRVFYNHYGQRGLDIAFYTPRARYHTEDDDARHASLNSVWHMLSAALASTQELSQTTGTKFYGARSDGDGHLVQNGKATEGVWFDLFGSAWAALPLRGLFAWSLCLLVATPLTLLLVTYLLIRQDKYYLFARDFGLHSDDSPDPVKLGGWRGVFRFPLALIFAGGLTLVSALLLAKVNPFIVYSSGYAVWAMALSLFYFSFWLIVRGASFVRPSALHRGFVTIWLFIIGWAIQVFAAVVEDRMHVGSLYSMAFLHSAFFVAAFLSLCELFSLPRKQEFATMQLDADSTGNPGAHESGRDGRGNEDRSDDRNNSDEDSRGEPTETTPLTGGHQNYGSGEQATFANAYRRPVSAEETVRKKTLRVHQPYDGEQAWSGRLPKWTWVIQLLVLAPVPVMLMGNLGLTMSSALNMTGVDGGNVWTPLLSTAIFSIFLLLPLTPFMHRVTHHVPAFLLLVFIGTFIYSMVAFPFSANNRFKFYFQQVVDLDRGTNIVHLTGVEEYVRAVVSSLPEGANQKVDCETASDRPSISQCQYDASSQSPDLAVGRSLEDLLTISTSLSPDGLAAEVQIDAPDTRTCYLETSEPIFGFSVEGGGERNRRFGPLPPEGFKTMQLWRRKWEGPWNVTLQLTPGGQSGVEAARSVKPLSVTIRCAWSDANDPRTIPALTELKKYMPTWAVVTKAMAGLVEVRKSYAVTA